MSLKKLLFLALGVLALSFSTVSCTSESQDFADEQTAQQDSDAIKLLYTNGHARVTGRYKAGRKTFTFYKNGRAKRSDLNRVTYSYYITRGRWWWSADTITIVNYGTFNLIDLNRV